MTTKIDFQIDFQTIRDICDSLLRNNNLEMLEYAVEKFKCCGFHYDGIGNEFAERCISGDLVKIEEFWKMFGKHLSRETINECIKTSLDRDAIDVTKYLVDNCKMNTKSSPNSDVIVLNADQQEFVDNFMKDETEKCMKYLSKNRSNLDGLCDILRHISRKNPNPDDLDMGQGEFFYLFVYTTITKDVDLICKILDDDKIEYKLRGGFYLIALEYYKDDNDELYQRLKEKYGDKFSFEE